MYIKRNYFNLSHLSANDEELLFKEICTTLQQRMGAKKRILPTWIQTSVAAAIAIIITIVIFQYGGGQTQQKEIIIGKELQLQEIQLISNNKITSFKENIDIEIDANGTAQVKTNSDNKNNGTTVNVHEINTLIVPYGKRTTLILSDGSKVWLNSGSTLEFPSKFTGRNREILLTSGEMYIEVAPNKQKTFHVRTSNFNIEVHGTKFNISLYEESPKSVVLVEGKVTLQTSNKKETILLPGEKAIFMSSDYFETHKVNTSQAISWTNGYLEFDELPVSEVLKYVERYYNISFNYENSSKLSQITCKGRLNLTDNIDNVMNSIALLSSSTYKRENNTIYITNIQK